MKKIKSFLSEICCLYNQAEKDRLDRIKHGDFFNVFNTIGLRTEEVRLHSAFIAELLNPKGKHGLSTLFLQAFLTRLELPCDFVNDAKGIITERYIGPKTKTNGGRIDIIIENGNHAVIIENKIYADDQENQLLRYNNYGKKYFKDGFVLVYLTIDGDDPDEKSLGKKGFPFCKMSYKNHIVEWLDNCVEIARAKPLAQAVLIQYRELIKQITNSDMNTKYKEKLLGEMMKPETIIAVGEMMSVQEDWFVRVLDEYVWKPIQEYAETKGLRFGKDIKYGQSGAWLYRPKWKYYGIFVWTERKCDWSDMCVGISWFEQPDRKNKIHKKDFQIISCLNEAPSDDWPYGKKFLPPDIRNWDNSIIKDFVSGDVANSIILLFDKILMEIDKNKLRMP